jgi:poly(ADP-ribose) glycohydrolase ARH3
MDLSERFSGCLLGLALGDAVGAPFEGSSQGLKPGCQDHLPELLRYTDDTEMAIGVAESLIASEGFHPDHMARTFAENYHPFRGYGPGTAAILNLIGRGMNWREANTMVFEEGSFGNGAAMRVAPLGLFYSSRKELLREAVEEASSITHGHPLGKEGAVILAFAVAAILAQGNDFDKDQFLDTLIDCARLDEYIRKLSLIRELCQKEPVIDTIVDSLGNNILAHESVPTALYAFLKYGNDFHQTIGFCISLGGDTDTIGAMAGALCGCLMGERSLPQDWIDKLEDDRRGMQYIRHISGQLYTVHLRYSES